MGKCWHGARPPKAESCRRGPGPCRAQSSATLSMSSEVLICTQPLIVRAMGQDSA